jgi:hypothetical protein
MDYSTGAVTGKTRIVLCFEPKFRKQSGVADADSFSNLLSNLSSISIGAPSNAEIPNAPSAPNESEKQECNQSDRQAVERLPIRNLGDNCDPNDQRDEAEHAHSSY